MSAAPAVGVSRADAMRAFCTLFRGSAGALAWSLAAAIAQSLALVPIALLVRHAFDRTIPAGDTSALIWIGAIVLGLYLLSAALGLATRYVVLVTTKAAVTGLRTRLVERLHALPRAYHDRRDLGTLQATVVQDTERVDMTASALMAQLIPATVIGLSLSATLVVLEPALFALLLVVLPLLFAVSRLIGHAVRERTRVWQRAFDVFSRQTLNALRGMTLTKAHAVEPAVVARRAEEHERLGDAGRRMAWMQSAYTLVNGAVAASAGVFVLVAGGAAVASGRMTAGSLFAFYAVLALLRGQAGLILATVPQVIAGLESMVRLQEILAADEPEPYRGTRRVGFRGAVAVEAVEFGYGDRPILRGASLAVGAGERVALLGPNGAGKSTLLALVLGLYRPWSGHMSADGVPYDELDMRALRARVGVVLQDLALVPGTIAENIAAGRPGATEDEVRAAAALATVDDFAARLPLGYETAVGDAGTLISAGQRQRIALARALVRRPALLVLDEPTSHMDDGAAGRVRERLRALPGDPAVLIATHDPALAAVADRVVELRGGRVLAADGAAPETLALGAEGGPA